MCSSAFLCLVIFIFFIRSGVMMMMMRWRFLMNFCIFIVIDWCAFVRARVIWNHRSLDLINGNAAIAVWIIWIIERYYSLWWNSWNRRKFFFASFYVGHSVLFLKCAKLFPPSSSLLFFLVLLWNYEILIYMQQNSIKCDNALCLTTINKHKKYKTKTRKQRKKSVTR